MEYKFQFTNSDEYLSLLETHKDKKLILTEYNLTDNFLYFTDALDEKDLAIRNLQEKSSSQEMQISQQEQAIAELTMLVSMGMM